MSKIRWVVLVADPDTEGLRQMYLQDNGGVPRCIWTINNIEYWEVDRYDCILDAMTEVKVLQELGWRMVRAEPIA